MRVIQCMSCGTAKKRPGYWREYGLRDDRDRPVFCDSKVYELGSLRYCGNCLIHAQLVLTELLGGADAVYEIINSPAPHILKDFATPNSSHPNRTFWHYSLNAMLTGMQNES